MADKFGWQKLAKRDATKRGLSKPPKKASNYLLPTEKSRMARKTKGSIKPGRVVIGFGKYEGRQLRSIPKEYLWWCLYHVQGLEPGLARDIVKVVGNGKKYASQRGWVMKPLTPPKQPPKQPGCQQWFWGRGSEYAGEVRQMDKHLHDISKECVGSGYVPFTGNPQELPFDVDLHQTQ